MKLLEGQTALITGANRGIGRAIALKFAGEGANIAFTDLAYDDNSKSLEEECRKQGVKARMFPSDASKYDQVEQAVKKILEEFGTIHILVNNAGITRDTLLMRMTQEQWDSVITVNLGSVFNFTKAVQMTMLKQKEGSIINISSVVGVAGNAGQANYAASKAGIIGFTKSMAKELGPRNIRCNALAPGFIMTDMTNVLPEDIRENWIKTVPLKRAGTPEDVAKAALFLASDLSSYITGQVMNVCGGMH
jgi:3-oxoacyl-[acyl-carrier protein] reductase